MIPSTSEILSIKPELILLDHKVSNGLGETICRQLKADLAAMKIPVIMISTYDNIRTIAEECGADDHISSPLAFRR